MEVKPARSLVFPMFRAGVRRRRVLTERRSQSNGVSTSLTMSSVGASRKAFTDTDGPLI